MNTFNMEDSMPKKKIRNIARILALAGSIPMLIWVFISYFINTGTGFEMAAMMLNGMLVIVAIIAFIRPLLAGVFGLALSVVYAAAMTSFFLHFSNYQLEEQLSAVIVTLLLVIYIAGSILHIYTGRKLPQGM